MNFRRYATAVSGLALLISLFGCGSSSNDQGVSFVLTGYYPTTATSITDAGLSGVTVPLGAIGGGTDDGSAGDVKVDLGLENALGGVGVRVERVNLDYFIPGSSIQPPSTSQSLGVVLGPSLVGTSSSSSSSTGIPTGIPGQTTLPPGFTGVGSSVVAEVSVVPPAVFQWLVLNQDQLPPLPFDMQIDTTVVGVTTAGDELSTNSATLEVQFTSGVLISSGSGDGSSSSDDASSSAAP